MHCPEGIHLYVNDSNFGQVWDSCSKHAFEGYYRYDGVLE